MKVSTYVYLCLVLLQVPKFFVPFQIFWASPKIWLHLVPLQKLLSRHINEFYRMQIIFLSGTKCLWLEQYVNKFLVWHKKFGTAQNILWPVKGQGIRVSIKKILNWLMYTVPYFIKKKSVINIFHGLQMRVLCIRIQLSLRVWIIQKICHTFSSFIRTDGVSFFKEMHKYSILIKL